MLGCRVFFMSNLLSAIPPYTVRFLSGKYVFARLLTVLSDYQQMRGLAINFNSFYVVLLNLAKHCFNNRLS